jgi:four helix bundle protein
MSFDALEVSLELIRSLPRAITLLRERDPQLHRQIRAAASSVPLNLAEGRRRVGKDRLHHFRIAAGSADELRVALLIARAWGDLEARDVGEALLLLDRLLAMLWRLTQ